MYQPSLDLHVVHETAYHYATSVKLAHHLGYMRPLEDPHQSVEAFQLAITPEPSHHANDRDSWGNARVYFSLYAPHRALTVRAESRVRLSARFAGLDRYAAPAWETVRRGLRYASGAPWSPYSEFMFASPFVPMHAELREYAAVSFTPGRPLIDAALELMQRIYKDFKYDDEATDIDTPVLDAFKQKSGVCQDFAHVMIGCLRATGLAVRYVSGYLLTEPPPGKPRLQGADASHAWVSVYCPGMQQNAGWLDLDPTNNIVPALSHVTLAIGRDYGDVTPLRGIIRGGGEHTLDVAVTVEPMADFEARLGRQSQSQRQH